MLFSRKEKKVEELFLVHVTKVSDALGHLSNLLRQYLKCDKEFKQSALRVHQSENEADIVKQQIEGLLYEGAFLPINRGDYIILAEFIDRIANQAEKNANLIVTTRPAIPDFLQEDLIAILERGKSATDSFGKALKEVNTDIERLKEMVLEVKTYEKEVDRLQWEAVKKVFKSGLDLAHKLHLRELINDMGGISDLAEDASERLGIMIVKRPL